ncbi:hypothetical protein V4C53_30095 [Paraburkholderia azotifigens]|uniref:hypothetical protein n=1 Tax=Paraburkholderia azotifigens TaxID=2057004 RepID=UPI00317E4406
MARKFSGVIWGELVQVTARGKKNKSAPPHHPNGTASPSLINPKQPRRLRKALQRSKE